MAAAVCVRLLTFPRECSCSSRLGAGAEAGTPDLPGEMLRPTWAPVNPRRARGGYPHESAKTLGFYSSEYQALEENRSKIGKAHYKWVAALEKRCFVPGVVFEGADGIVDPRTGVLFDWTPDSVFQLGDYINANAANGVACKGIVAIRAEFPGYQDVILLITNATNLLPNAAITLDLVYLDSKCM